MFTYEGKQYDNYYQLSKAMRVHRATIQYRHEKLGIPIDEIKDYVSTSNTNRFGEKKYFAKKASGGTLKVNESEIINYPKFPEIPYSLGIDEQVQLKQELMDWSKNCPKLLLNRAIHLLEEDYQQLVILLEEQGQFAYSRENNELKKEFYHEIVSSMRGLENNESENRK